MTLRPANKLLISQIIYFGGGFSMTRKKRPLEMAISGRFSIF